MSTLKGFLSRVPILSPFKGVDLSKVSKGVDPFKGRSFQRCHKYFKGVHPFKGVDPAKVSIPSKVSITSRVLTLPCPRVSILSRVSILLGFVLLLFVVVGVAGGAGAGGGGGGGAGATAAVADAVVLVNTSICVVGHVMPMMWHCTANVYVTAAVIAVVGGCAAAVAVVAAVAHTHFCSHKHEMFMMLLGHVWWCW